MGRGGRAVRGWIRKSSAAAGVGSADRCRAWVVAVGPSGVGAKRVRLGGCGTSGGGRPRVVAERPSGRARRELGVAGRTLGGWEWVGRLGGLGNEAGLGLGFPQGIG